MTLLLNLCHIYFKVCVDEGFCCTLSNICPVFCCHELKFWHEKWRSDPGNFKKLLLAWYFIIVLIWPHCTVRLPLLREKICDIFESRLSGGKEWSSLMQFFFPPFVCSDPHLLPFNRYDEPKALPLVLRTLFLNTASYLKLTSRIGNESMTNCPLMFIY